MTKIPRHILSRFGEFIVEHNKMDYKLKLFLAGFVENEMIGHLLTSSQSLEFIKKRVNSIFKHIIVDNALTIRWDNLHAEMSELNEVRNDIAHSIIDIEPETKKMFVITRFTENSVLKFAQKEKLYELDDLKSYVSRLKKLNKKLSYLFHTTYKKHYEIIHYDGHGTMF